MKTKAKGFTILEVILTLAITSLIIGVMYSFFFTSNRTLGTTELNSMLQSEGELIEGDLLAIGTQANGILTIDGQPSDGISNRYSELPTDISNEKNNYKRQINRLELKFDNDDIAKIECVNEILTLEIVASDGRVIEPKKILSNNVKQFKIRPLDIRMVSNLDLANFSTAPGLEFSIRLEKKKGYSSVNYEFGTLVKFRNM